MLIPLAKLIWLPDNRFWPILHYMNCTNNRNNSPSAQIRFVTIAGLICNIILSILKVTLGVIGNSQSVVADGIHSISDCSTDIAVLVGLKYWNMPPDKDHPYGHRRIETLVASFIGLSLIAAAAFLGKEAVDKFRSGSFVVPAPIALSAALISILVKEFLYRWTYKVGVELKSPSMKANAWHHRSDAFSSVAVAAAIACALINPNWAILDPVAAIVVAMLILQAAIKIIKPSLHELTDAGASASELEQIEKIVLSIEQVNSVHALRSRFHGEGMHIDLHIQIDGNLSVREGHVIAGKTKHLLIERGPNIVDVLVHVEPFEPDDLKP